MGKFLRGTIALFIVIAFVGGMALPASAEVTLDSLLKRIEALEQENTALKAEVMAVKERQAAAPAPAAVAAAPAGNFMKTGPEVTLYGFVKADYVRSSSDMGNGVITQFSAARPGNDDPETHLSAQDTRLGFNFKAPDLDEGGKVTGKLEIDFGNSVTASSVTYTPRLRLAYVDVAFEKWAVNAGMNWDIVAPLNPAVLDPGTLWKAGNLGYRHPEVTLTNKLGEFLGGNLTTKLGLIDSDEAIQEDSGIPVVAAFVGYDRDIMGVKSSFGLGGLYGKLNLASKKGVADSTLYATTANMTLKFTDWLCFKTEGFVGAGLSKFMGGAQTAANSSAATGKAIPVKGGFMELTYKPFKKLETNVGIGIDDVNEDMTGYTTADKSAVWDKNRTHYINMKYSLSKELLVGLEFQQFDTKWLDHMRSHDQRIETSIIYKF